MGYINVSLNMELLNAMSYSEIVELYKFDPKMLRIVLKATGKKEQKADKVDKPKKESDGKSDN